MTAGIRSASPWNTLAELAATGIALVAATASGAVLFALQATARYGSFRDLLRHVGLPAVAVLLVIVVVAAAVGWQRLWRAMVIGAAAGVIATIGLEAVRITGFRVFHTFPGDMPTLMGTLATNRIMLGPNMTSTVFGYLDHYYNGAAFGIIFALMFGGFPRRWGVWSGALLGAAYALVIGTGFLTGYGILTPTVPHTLGVGGIFSTVSETGFQITVYTAHLVFGLVLGALVHRFGTRLPPVWAPVVDLGRQLVGSSPR